MGDRPILRRSKIDPSSCTMVEWAYSRTGSILEAGRVVAYVVKYAAAREALGHDPTVAEYASWWKESEATAYRHNGQFRDVFGLDNPAIVLADLERQRVGVQDRIDLTGLVAI